MSYRLGVDVGGTFTDLLLVNEKTGALHTAKVPSTPEDSSIGVFNGINRVCDNAGVDPSQINTVMHGTTVATNTILTCLLYTSPSPRDMRRSRMPSSA